MTLAEATRDAAAVRKGLGVLGVGNLSPLSWYEEGHPLGWPRSCVPLRWLSGLCGPLARWPLDVLGVDSLSVVGMRTVGSHYLNVVLGAVAKNFDDGANRTVFELYPLSLLVHRTSYLST